MTFRSRWKRLAICAAVFLLPASRVSSARGQEQPAPPPQQAQTQASSLSPQQSQSETASQEQGDKTEEQKTGTSSDRLFYTLPNFLTVDNATEVPRLTAGQKFNVVARSSFDHVEFVWYGFLAGVSQAENSEPGYGQGAEGYGKRYGAAFADGTIENFWTAAVLPSVLHQDPRFYQMPEGGFVHRTEYAVSRIFVTRTDSGGRQFNFSEIFGSAIAAAISTYSYHPRSDRTIGNTATVWSSQIGYDTITIEVKEFWPDIKRVIHSRRESASNQTP